MRSNEWDRQKVLFLAVLTLSFGFLLGTLHYDYNLFGWAQTTASGQQAQPQKVNRDMEKPEAALATAKKLEKAFHYATSQVRPAVVSIVTRATITQRRKRVPNFPGFQDPFFRRFFNRPRRRQAEGLGSGLIIRSNGYILTNRHVVEKADEIEVDLGPRETAKATVEATDPNTDLAVIKVDRTGLPTAEFADSDKVKVGQYAIAIGAPFHYKNSVSFGQISALHRSIGKNQYEDLLQTDAAINPGNSGGPLVDIDGKVIGINTAIAAEGARGNQGIGFAISANMAKNTANDLIEYGKPRRPWLGVKIQQVTPEMAEHFDNKSGVVIAEVLENSPAAQAGLQQGDLIIEFEGEPINSPGDLQRMVLSRSIDEAVSLTVDRGGEAKQLTVKLGMVPEESTTKSSRSTPESGILDKLGLKLEKIPPEQAAEKHGIQPPRTVLKITAVSPGGPAARKGLQDNDLIVEVDRQQIPGLEEFASYLKEKKEAGEENVLLLVKHEGSYYWRILPLL